MDREVRYDILVLDLRRLGTFLELLLEHREHPGKQGVLPQPRARGRLARRVVP